jgi:uncharacterized protein (TIGR03118 family)
MFNKKNSLPWLYAIVVSGVFIFAACKSDTTTPDTTRSTAFMETALVADTAGYGAARIDTTYKNGWGIAVGSSGIFWLSSNHGGVTDIFKGDGSIALPPITIPSRNGTDPGSPTGVIFNSTSTSDFNNAKFIYATEDGLITIWNGGTTAQLAATDASSDAVYKGIAMANNGGNNYLYVTDFGENKIVVYDKNFNPVTMAFTEAGSPGFTVGTPGYGPFGIQEIGGLLYVTYALHKPAPDDGDDAGGAGNGYISVFKPDGTFLRRFASNGKLSSPWGLAIAPSTFGQFANAILVSNFGDGTISGFDSTGKFLGQVSTDDNNTPMIISGIWGILTTSSTPNGSGDVTNAVYFTAGPADEDHGIFGYIQPK